MTSPTNQGHLIDELESRQNDVLNRLAELNARVEGLLNECLAARDARLQEMDKSKPTVAPPMSSSGQTADPTVTE